MTSKSSFWKMHFMTLLVRVVGQVTQVKDACSWSLAGALPVRCPSRAYSSHRLSRWFLTLSRVWGGTAFAKRSGAMKAPVGLLSGSAVCDSRWRGFAPTSATPTRSLRKCSRIEEVKSRWSTTFSKIENLWPRDGSCPLPLRSKRIFNKCFRIVKTQKISSGALLM